MAKTKEWTVDEVNKKPPLFFAFWGVLAAIIALVIVGVLVKVSGRFSEGPRQLAGIQEPAMPPGATPARQEPQSAGGGTAVAETLIGTSSADGAEAATSALSRPATVIGDTLKVRGQVEQVFSPRAFVLAMGADTPGILVLQQGPGATDTLRPGVAVVVQGKMTHVKVVTAAQDATLGLDAAFLRSYGDRPTFVVPNAEVP
jgi:hypothetical protein